MRRFACLMTSFSGGPVWSYWAPHFQPRDLMRPQGRWRPFQRRHFAPNIHLWPLWTSSKSSLSWINKMSNHAPVTVWHTWAQKRFAAGFLDVFGWEEYEKLKKIYYAYVHTLYAKEKNCLQQFNSSTASTTLRSASVKSSISKFTPQHCFCSKHFNKFFFLI